MHMTVDNMTREIVIAFEGVGLSVIASLFILIPSFLVSTLVNNYFNAGNSRSALTFAIIIHRQSVALVPAKPSLA
jgi:hypothetical protein